MSELHGKLKRREEPAAATSSAPSTPLTQREPVDSRVFNKLDATNGSSGDEELRKVKRALLTLQAQTKAAVEGMLQRIDHQQKERLKLVAVVRDVKAAVTQQQEATKLLEQQTRFVYQELQKLQQDVLAIKK